MDGQTRRANEERRGEERRGVEGRERVQRALIGFEFVLA